MRWIAYTTFVKYDLDLYFNLILIFDNQTETTGSGPG